MKPKSIVLPAILALAVLVSLAVGVAMGVQGLFASNFMTLSAGAFFVAIGAALLAVCAVGLALKGDTQ